jgi:hypothetical protein
VPVAERELVPVAHGKLRVGERLVEGDAGSAANVGFDLFRDELLRDWLSSYWVRNATQQCETDGILRSTEKVWKGNYTSGVSDRSARLLSMLAVDHRPCYSLEMGFIRDLSRCLQIHHAT